MYNALFQGLNYQQQEAVLATEGRIRVVAGAGAGKTKTLAHRFAYLVNELGISPAHILCLTFTNKAANEMRQRIKKMVDEENVNDFISTIHGFCVKILRRDIHRLGFTNKFIILDEEDRKTIAKQIFEELGVERGELTVKEILKEVADAKSLGGYITQFMLPDSPKGPINDENRKLAIYTAKQLKTFSLDFNDLVHFALYLLETYDDVREHWQEEIEYIMLDEAQDCSLNDWKIVETIAEKNKNLFIVGDPDQAIYEWRGASPKYFVDFANDRTIILNQNYRSTPNILNVANSIIKNNVDRVEKDLFTAREEGKTVIHFHGKSEIEEMQWISKQIREAHEAGVAYKDFCILYRATSMTRQLEQELMKQDIRYKIYGGIRFYERKEIKDALSYLRLIEQNDDISFLRVINEPSRKMGKVFVEKIEDYAKERNLSLYDALKEMVDCDIVTKETAVEFINTIQAAKNWQYKLSISDLLEYILLESGYTEMLRFESDKERLENLEALKHAIEYYEKANANEDISLTTFLQDIALYTNTDEEMSSDVVKLMTIHQSKGLEFPFVFVIGLYEGGLPNYRAIRIRKREAIEEERRLVYVAVTRAENALFLTESEGFDYASNTYKYPSQFLSEIKRDLFITEGKMDEELWKESGKFMQEYMQPRYEDQIIFNVNQYVEHKIFGIGRILQVFNNGESYKVHFEDKTRTLQFSFLKAAQVKKFPKPKKRVRTQDDIEDETLFKMLLEWRKNAAKEEGVADFAILGEPVLHDLATFKPTDEETMLSIKGIGPAKYVTYGDKICKLIKEYIEQNEKKN